VLETLSCGFGPNIDPTVVEEGARGVDSAVDALGEQAMVSRSNE
jgi:hypothetical protein